MWTFWCDMYRSALGPSRTVSALPRGGAAGGAAGGAPGAAGGGRGGGGWRVCRAAWWSQRRKWWDHKPSSVYPLVRADGHLSGIAVASHLVRPTRSSDDPGRVSLLIWPCSDRGLPCRACCQTRGGLLPHRFTLTLWIQGRSVLCGPVPSPLGAQALPGGLPCGARTFLDAPLQPVHRDHRPHHFPAGKVPGHRSLGQGFIWRDGGSAGPRCRPAPSPTRIHRVPRTRATADGATLPPRRARGPDPRPTARRSRALDSAATILDRAVLVATQAPAPRCWKGRAAVRARTSPRAPHSHETQTANRDARAAAPRAAPSRVRRRHPPVPRRNGPTIRVRAVCRTAQSAAAS